MTFFGNQRPRGFQHTFIYAQRRTSKQGRAQADDQPSGADHEQLRAAFRRHRQPSRLSNALRSIPFVLLLLIMLILLMVLLMQG